MLTSPITFSFRTDQLEMRGNRWGVDVHMDLGGVSKVLCLCEALYTAPVSECILKMELYEPSSNLSSRQSWIFVVVSK